VGNGYYSDGTNCYDVQFGNGYVQSVSTCFYTVDLYATHGDSSSPNAIDIYYSNDNVTYTFAASLAVTTTCTQLFPSPSINIANGGTVYFKVQDANLVRDIYFNANDGTANNCPGNSQTYCTYSFTVNNNTVVNLTAYIDTFFGTFIDC
jgi:hypothetical protein